jgi:hypothetical protein
MSWQVKPGCAEHHRAAVERAVNLLPLIWLLHLQTGEIFNDLDHCNRRLRGYALAEGFDIVRKGGGFRSNPSWQFYCLHHGESTRNYRKLEDRVELDEEGSIISNRQRDGTTVRQLGCQWEGLCSFKSIGKQRTEPKGYILTMKCGTHNGHKLADDPFQFQGHLKDSEEFRQAISQAKKHRQQVLPYSDSRRLIETIVALLRMLEDNGFVYRTRVSIEEDEYGTSIARKLIQLFWAHRKQLQAAQRFVADWAIIIDGTFNTNELRLPLLVCVGVLNTNKIFPVAFSFCPSESTESISFVWECLKAECFIDSICAPRVVIGDWAAGLIASVSIAFPNTQFQGCDWHAVGAMLKWFRGKGKDYTSEEIDGSEERLFLGQSKADLRVPGLHHFCWKYIKSQSLEELYINRANLVALLRPQDQHYISQHWRSHEREVIYYYTKAYANLGSHSSQRGESYHPVVREITNGQLSFEDSGKALSKKILSICKDLDSSEYASAVGYNRLSQLHGDAFEYLRCAVSKFGIEKIEIEWKRMCTMLEEQQGK